MNDVEIQQHYDDFYEEVFTELEKVFVYIHNINLIKFTQKIVS